MPAYTYLGQHEYLEPTSDKHINEALTEVRKLTGEDIRVREKVFVERHGFLRRKVRTRRSYELYINSYSCEYQIFNFYPGPDAVSSFNWSVNASVIVAYLWGLHTGRSERVAA